MRFIGVMILVLTLFLSCNSTEKEKVSYLSSQDMVMAPPIIESNSLFFTDSVEVKMNFAMPNSTIRYTLDGSQVNEQSQQYGKAILLKETTTLKAKNFHPEFQSGPSTTLKVMRTNTKLAGSTVEINPAPNERYQGNGNFSLTDLKKGTLAFANDNSWLGFQSDSVTADIKFSKAQSISKVTVSAMANHGAWIFLPKSITIFSGKKEIGTTIIQKPSEGDASKLEFIEIQIEENKYENLKVLVTSLEEIPEWHQGKGTPPWLFVDEILVE